MADYKFALKLHQDKTGSENAKAKISIGGNVVAAEVEITPESATLYSYDVTGLADTVNIDNSVTTLVKVELLNDLYVDSDNDRNIIWSGCGYVQKMMTVITIAKQLQQMTTGIHLHQQILQLFQISPQMLRLTGLWLDLILVIQQVLMETTAEDGLH
jgi:hypothetical protein